MNIYFSSIVSSLYVYNFHEIEGPTSHPHSITCPEVNKMKERKNRKIYIQDKMVVHVNKLS